MKYKVLIYSLADIMEVESIEEVNELLVREEVIRKNICIVLSENGDDVEKAIEEYRRSVRPKPKPTPPPSNYGNGK